MSKPKNYPFVEPEVSRILKDKVFGSTRFVYIDDVAPVSISHALVAIRLNGGEYIPAPMYFEVVDWLRDVHGISVYLRSDSGHPDDWTTYIEHLGRPVGQEDVECYLMQESYYTALQRGVEEALKLI